MSKKFGITFYIHTLVCILSIAGFIFIFITDSVAGYALKYRAATIAMGVLGMIAVIAGTAISFKFGAQCLFTVLLKFVSLICFGVVITLLVLARAELASSLFSWDSRNEVGWNAFIMAIISIVFYVACELALIACGFIADEKIRRNLL